MELTELLKKIRTLKADSDYVRSSRAAIVGEAGWQTGTLRKSSPWQVLVHGLQFGSAVTLASIFVVLVIGGFSTWKFLSPFRLASLDPVGLRAEAQAVDIQIQLTNIDYSEPAGGAATTPKIAADAHAARVAELAKNLGVDPLAGGPTSSKPVVTIDEALDRLAE